MHKPQSLTSRFSVLQHRLRDVANAPGLAEESFWALVYLLGSWGIACAAHQAYKDLSVPSHGFENLAILVMWCAVACTIFTSGFYSITRVIRLGRGRG